MKIAGTIRQAIETFGADHQKRLAIEEMAELTNALAKEGRGRVSDTDIITEIADVQIMIWQLSEMYNREKVGEEIDRKLKRLDSTILNEKLKQIR